MTWGCTRWAATATVSTRHPISTGWRRRDLVFDQAYATAPVCSPSRAGLYTGRHPARLHLTNYIPGTEPDNAPLSTPPWTPFLPVEEPTIGDHFKTAGYETCPFRQVAPRDRLQLPARPAHRSGVAWIRPGVVHPQAQTGRRPGSRPAPHRCPDRPCPGVSRRESHDKPFICFVAHNAIHRPEMAPEALIDQFRRQGRMRTRTATAPSSPPWCPISIPPSVACSTPWMPEPGRRQHDRHLHRRPWRVRPDCGAKTPEGRQGRPLRRRRARSADRSTAGRGQPRAAGGNRHPEYRFPAHAGRDWPAWTCRAGDYDGRSIAACLTGGDPGETGDLFWHFPHYHHQGVSPCGAMRQRSLQTRGMVRRPAIGKRGGSVRLRTL